MRWFTFADSPQYRSHRGADADSNRVGRQGAIPTQRAMTGASTNPAVPNVKVKLRSQSDPEASWAFSPLPNVPRCKVGCFDVASKAIRIE